MTMTTWFTAAAGFEAARHLDALADGHRARRLHGHGFLATLRCAPPANWAAFAGGEVAQLQRALASGIEPLDYRLLNDLVDQPSDANLARWLSAQLAVPGIAQLGIQSTADQGALIDATGQVRLWRRYRFHSAHRLPRVPLGHKCGRMHGHGFEVVLHALQPADADGADMGYDRLDAAWAPLHIALNYGCLNDIDGLENPTSEIMSSWIWQRLKPALPELASVTVYETASCGAHFDGQHYRIWKEFTLDSAVQLRGAPVDSPLARLHGHTYTLRLHLCAPLDQVKGWTVDFGDVKDVFHPVFKALDHQPLYQIPDLADCDSASLARWIMEKSRSQLPQLDRVDLCESRGCGATVALADEGAALPV